MISMYPARKYYFRKMGTGAAKTAHGSDFDRGEHIMARHDWRIRLLLSDITTYAVTAPMPPRHDYQVQCSLITFSRILSSLFIAVLWCDIGDISGPRISGDFDFKANRVRPELDEMEKKIDKIFQWRLIFSCSKTTYYHEKYTMKIMHQCYSLIEWCTTI